MLAVAPGPRESEALALGVAAYLGEERVAELPAWEALLMRAIYARSYSKKAATAHPEDSAATDPQQQALFAALVAAC